MTYDERRVYNDGEGCQHGTEVYRHVPSYRHYCLDCDADLDDLVDLEGLQSDLEELEATDPIVKAAAESYDRMVASVTRKVQHEEFLEYQAQHLNPAQVESLRAWLEEQPDDCEKVGHEIITMCSRCGIEAHEL